MLVARTRRPKRTSRKRSWRQRGRILGLFATILSVAAIVILAGPSRMAMTGPAQKGIAPPEVSAKSVFVLNADTGRVLYEKNPDEVFRILSLTKLVTAYILVDRMGDRLSETIKINWPHLTGGSSAQLKRLDVWTLQDLLYGMVLVSGKCLEECMEKLRDESKAMMQDPEGVELMDITHHATYQDGTEYSGVMVKDGQTTRMYTRMRFRNGVLYVFTMGAERELDMNLMLDCMVFRNPRSLLKGRYTIG